MKDELRNATDEKTSLEEEIKNRNEEMYTMNEKLIFLEFQKTQQKDQPIVDDQGRSLALTTSNQVQELKYKIEQNNDANIRRVFDL